MDTHQFICHDCDEDFCSKNQLKKHKRYVHQNQALLSGTGFDSVLLNRVDGVFKCPVDTCSNVFVQPRDIQAHYKKCIGRDVIALDVVAQQLDKRGARRIVPMRNEISCESGGALDLISEEFVVC